MYRKTVLDFSRMDYAIEGFDYRYNDGKPPVFYTNAIIRVPQFKQPISIGLPYDRALENVEKKDAGMAKYVRKVLEGYSDKPESELLAFESLEYDGFDLKQFMTYMLSGIRVEIEQT